VLTHRDTTMLQKLAGTIQGELLHQTPGGCLSAPPITKDSAEVYFDGKIQLYPLIRAILNELKQVDEGMVKAANALNFVRIPTPKRKAAIFRAMIDQVLREGE